MRSALLVLLLVGGVLAGCITDVDEGGPETASCDPGPFDQPGIRIIEDPMSVDPLDNMSMENAFDFETTNVRTCSLAAIGHTPLDDDGTPHYYIGEIDMRGDLDLGAVAVLGNHEAPQIYLLDINEPAKPKVLSVIEQQKTYIVDVKISDDGDLLFAASQSSPYSPELAQLPEFETPIGFTVYDISDPAQPRHLTFIPDTSAGCHMMSHEIINGDDYLFCVSQGIRAYHLERVQDTVVSLGYSEYIASDADDLPRPGRPSVPLPARPPSEATTPVYAHFNDRPHDITVQVDEVTGETFGIVSHWSAGLRVIGLDDLPTITERGAWRGEGATHYEGNVHTAMMFYADGTRYIMASPEYTFDGAVPGLWVLDATDLNDLKLVAEWYHPNLHESQGLFLTTHQWQVAPVGRDVAADDVRIYLTMNHGGLWVLDFGAVLEGDHAGAILGYNLARMELDPELADVSTNVVLATWDVNVVDGYIYGSDRATGLWVFHYAGDRLGDDAVTGFA